MRALWLIALALLTCACPAWAQIGTPSLANPGALGSVCPGPGALCAPVPIPASYTGPFDIISSNKLFGWSTRLLTSGYTGKALYVCLTTNHTTCGDVGFDPTTHTLLATDISAICTVGSTCEVKGAYDQSGTSTGSGGTPSGNDVWWNTTSATTTRPLLINNCPSTGLYCLRFTRASNSALSASSSDGSISGATGTFSPSTVTNITMFSVFTNRSYTSNDGIISGGPIGTSSPTSTYIFFANSTPTVVLQCLSGACSSTITATWGSSINTSIHQYALWARNNSSQTIGVAVDQAAAVTTSGTPGTLQQHQLCLGSYANGGCNSGQSADSDIMEMVGYQADDSGSITGGISANQRTFWGTP